MTKLSDQKVDPRHKYVLNVVLAHFHPDIGAGEPSTLWGLVDALNAPGIEGPTVSEDEVSRALNSLQRDRIMGLTPDGRWDWQAKVR